jgi:hypothetical protein
MGCWAGRLDLEGPSEIPPMRLGDPLVALAAVGDHHAEAGPGEVEAVDALAGRGDFGEDFFSRRDCELRVVVEVDEPAGVLCRTAGLQPAWLVGRAKARGPSPSALPVGRFMSPTRCRAWSVFPMKAPLHAIHHQALGHASGRGFQEAAPDPIEIPDYGRI